jgi:hypothetical protein
MVWAPDVYVGSILRTNIRENIQPRKIQVMSILLEKNDGFEYTDNEGSGIVIRIVREMTSKRPRRVDRPGASG